MAQRSRPNRFDDSIYREDFYEGFEGLDLLNSKTGLNPRFLREAYNCRFTETGVKKRTGYENVYDSGNILRTTRAGLEIYTSTGSTGQVLIYTEASTPGNAKMGYFNPGTGVVTLAGSNVADQRPSLVQFGDLTFVFNGTDDYLIDASSAERQIGITPPGAAPTGASNTNGSLVVGASYKAVYTYYNSVTGAESSPSPLSDAVIVAADPNDGITWTVVAGSATTADTIRLYRTVANGSILFLDNTAAIGATSITSTTPDAGLGAELEIDNTRWNTWGKMKYAEVVGTRLFGAGFASPNANRVRWSKIGKAGPMPESSQASAFVDCESSLGSGDINVGLGAANDTPIVLKEQSVGKLVEIGSLGSEIGVDTVIMEYREMARNTNTVSHFATCNVYGNFVWLSRNNVYMTDGNQVIPIGDLIGPYLKTLNWSFPEKCSGHNNTKDKLVYFSILTDGTTTEPNARLVGDYSQFPKFRWSLDVRVTNPTFLSGYNVGCFFPVVESDGVQSTYFGSALFDGQILKENSSFNDNGYPIDLRVRTYPISFGYPEEDKLFFKDKIDAATSADSATLTVGAYYNLKNVREDEETIQVTGGTLGWDTGLTWDSGLEWDEGGALDIIEKSMHRKARYKEVYLYNNEVDVDMEIYGWTSMARPIAMK